MWAGDLQNQICLLINWYMHPIIHAIYPVHVHIVITSTNNENHIVCRNALSCLDIRYLHSHLK
jgi:hypothetical protein